MGLKTIHLPDLGEGVTEGEILKIKVSQGERIAMDQILLEVMTDKASMEIPSYVEGTVQAVEVSEGDIAAVGAKLFTVKTAGAEKSAPQKEERAKKTKAPASRPKPSAGAPKKNKLSGQPAILAVPATRKLAEELGLPLESVRGSGPQGEITRNDLLNHIKAKLKAPQTASAFSPSSAGLMKNFEEDRREPLRGVKRLMFSSMTLSKATIPHFTVGEQAQVERLRNMREEMKERLKKQGLKAGWLAFFIKALIPALKEFPIFNSVYDPQTQEIVFKKGLNIGFAVDSPNGLLAPVLKQAQNKTLLEIIKATHQLAESARQGDIQREDLIGASITLSNLGSLGGRYGTPIINPPEMAILGIYSLFQRTVEAVNGTFEEKPFMNFSITCDHRFIDGATAARFLKSFISKIEEPSLLLLE